MDEYERRRFNEYLQEHPEERVAVDDLILRSKAFDLDRQRRAEERLAKIRECREILMSKRKRKEENEQSELKQRNR